MPTWPTSLRQAPRYGMAETPDDNVARFRPDVGPGLARRRYTATGATVDAVFELTTAQVATLMDFFEIDCASGSLPFYWSHPLSGATGLYQFTGPPKIVAEAFDYNTVTIQMYRKP